MQHTTSNGARSRGGATNTRLVITVDAIITNNSCTIG